MAGPSQMMFFKLNDIVLELIGPKVRLTRVALTQLCAFAAAAAAARHTVVYSNRRVATTDGANRDELARPQRPCVAQCRCPTRRMRGSRPSSSASASTRTSTACAESLGSISRCKPIHIF